MRKWPVLNTRLGWSLFNLIFISIYQNFLLLGTVAPSFVVAASGNKDLNVIDVLAAISFITCFILETYADNQQEDFQNSKKMLLKNKEQQKPFDQGRDEQVLLNNDLTVLMTTDKSLRLRLAKALSA